MKRVFLVNSKGGSGKSTLSVNLAVALAARGKRVVLADCDPQLSTASWCERRPPEAVALEWLVLGKLRHLSSFQAPVDVDYLIVDTPAGIRAEELAAVLVAGDRVLVPMLPSVIDLDASERFVTGLGEVDAIANGEVRVGLVLNRVRPETISGRTALERIAQLPFPLLAQIRDTQAYLLSASMGKGLFDYHSQAARERQDDYRKLLRWLARN